MRSRLDCEPHWLIPKNVLSNYFLGFAQSDVHSGSWALSCFLFLSEFFNKNNCSTLLHVDLSVTPLMFGCQLSGTRQEVRGAKWSVYWLEQSILGKPRALFARQVGMVCSQLFLWFCSRFMGAGQTHSAVPSTHVGVHRVEETLHSCPAYGHHYLHKLNPDKQPVA